MPSWERAGGSNPTPDQPPRAPSPQAERPLTDATDEQVGRGRKRPHRMPETELSTDSGSSRGAIRCGIHPWAPGVSVQRTRVPRMTFANVGTLGAVSGNRDELVAHLTMRNSSLESAGCLAYEVGVNDDEPDTVFVVELWESAEAHRASLALPEVQAAIAAARPLLSGSFGGFRFEVAGSPLRD